MLDRSRQLRRAVSEELRVPGATNSWSELLKAIANKFLNYVGQTYIVRFYCSFQRR